MLGHASIQSTMRYAHATESDLRDALTTMHKARK
jgi:site-specific recombinase XerD